MKERHYPEQNPKLDKIIGQVRKKKEQLQMMVKESAQIKPPKEVKVVIPQVHRIATAVDHLPLDVQ